jgi:hypothetical protein
LRLFARSRRSATIEADLMTTISRHILATSAGLALAACLASCAPALPPITVKTPADPIAADPEKVTFVVVQPEARLRAVSVIDGRGQLVGQLDDRSHTVIRLAEGPTLLYAVAENKAETADRIEGTLLAGRVYYATVGAREGGVSFLVLTPRSPDGRWSHRSQYLASTPRVAMDPDRVVRTMNELGDTAPLMRAADAHVAKLDAASAAEHTLQESDGF